MPVQIHHELCNYCGACVSVCPSDALELIDTYLQVDAARCKDACRLCSVLCPVGALSRL